MINLFLLIFVVFAVRKVLWMISAKFMSDIEDKIKFSLCIIVSFVMFIADISAPTKTEKAAYNHSKRGAEKSLTAKKELFFNKKSHTNKTIKILKMLEPVTIERTKSITISKGSNKNDNSKAA